MRVLIFSFVVVTYLVTNADLCTWGEYDRCHEWEPCSESCGGGTKHRICESCVLGIDKDDYDDCNEICLHGHDFVSGSCRCPAWRSGRCCESCNYIHIDHCPWNKKECGGSPDGIQCTRCEDPYYSDGYNRGCIGCSGSVSRCDWSPWKSWDSCSRTCGGGRRSRWRPLCCKSSLAHDTPACMRDCGKDNSDSYDYEDCNEWCYNGGAISTYGCSCPDKYYGYCCSEECPAINMCKRRTCTQSSNVKCLECYGDKVIWNRRNSDTTCERLCSYANHYCWPGTCGSGLTKNCKCASGFKLVSKPGLQNISGETTCQIDTKPAIHTCRTVFVGPKREKKETKSSNSSMECQFLQDTYGNYQPSTIEFHMMSSFSVDTSAFDYKNKPPYVTEENFGISDTTLAINKKLITGNDVLLSKHNQTTDMSSSTQVTSDVANKGDVSVNASIYNVSNGQALCITYEAKAGGYLKNFDVRNNHTSGPIPYTKVSFQRQLCFRYDNASPEHCLHLKTCLSGEPLAIANRVIRVPISDVSFTGWTDPIPTGGSKIHASSLESYEISVHQVMPGNGQQMVDESPVYSRKITSSSSITSITLNLTSDRPMLYCIQLEVKDVADNVRQARRFVLYDNTTFIETKDDETFLVTSASQATSYGWQTHHHDICLNWANRFHNQYYLLNKLLNPVKPDAHGLITGIYEQNDGLLPVKGTPNVAGIVSFKISWSLNNGNYSNEIDVPDVLNQNYCRNFNVKDGQTYNFNIRSIDIVGNTFQENRTVHIDRSHPHINNIWLQKDGYKMLFVHHTKDISLMSMTFEALDPHSGLQEIEWRFGIADTQTELLAEHIGVKTLNTSCALDDITCYCPDVGVCERFSYSIPLNKLHLNNTHIGDHNRNYYFTIKVTNNAQLSNVEHIDVLVDDSPPEIGALYEGPINADDVDYTSADSFPIHWHGFIDHESGIKLYRLALSTRCLEKDELYNFTNGPEVEFYAELPSSEESITIPANFTGKRFITMIALNHAMAPSEALCSDGITRDLSAPDLRNLSLLNGAWSESVLCDNGHAFLMHSQLKKLQLKNTTSCFNICNQTNKVQITDFIPQVIGYEKDEDISDFLCSKLPRYSSKTIVYMPSDKINLNWDVEETGSQIDDFFVGLGKASSETESPSIVRYQSTARKTHFRHRHEGIGSDEIFFIFIKSLNKAGLEKVTALGPVLIDATPPVVGRLPNVTIKGDKITVGWEVNDFYDDEQTEQIDQIFFQIGHDDVQLTPLLEWRLDSSEPCPQFTGGCFSYPLRRLQKQDTDLGLEFYIWLHIYNNAGHYISARTESFALPSRYPPGHAVVHDIDPEFVYSQNKDIDVHFSGSLICASWKGFKHHESVNLEVGVGTTNVSDDVIAFRAIPEVDSHCLNDSSLDFYTTYYFIVRASCSGGATVSASNGVRIMNVDSLNKTLNVRVCRKCNHEVRQIINGTGFTVASPLRVGQPYELVSSTEDFGQLTSNDALIQSEPNQIVIIPLVHYPSFNISDSRKTAPTEIVLSSCVATNIVPYSDIVFAMWDVPNKNTAGLLFSTGLRTIGPYSVANRTMVKEFSEPSKPINHSFVNIDFSVRQTYAVVLRLCSKLRCISEMSSYPFRVQKMDPVGSIAEASIDPSSKLGHCYEVHIKWNAFTTISNISFYQWSVTRDARDEDTLLRDWSTVTPSSNQQFEVSECVDLPIIGHETLFACVRAFTKTGMQRRLCERLKTKPSIPDVNTVYDFDMNNPVWSSIEQLLTTSNLGEKFQVVHDNELQFGNNTSKVAGVMFYATERNVTWFLMTSKHVPSDCNLDTECILGRMTQTGFVHFEPKYIHTNSIYFVCAYSNITLVEREYFTETLDEISACSNGFVLDTTPPVGRKLHIASDSYYIVHPRSVIVHWDNFEEDIATEKLGFAENIKSYSYFVGTSQGRDDVIHTTFTNINRMDVMNLGDIEDGSGVYVSVTGTNHAGLSSTITSERFVVDASYPDAGSIGISNIMSDYDYVSDDFITVLLDGFDDPHSGIASYSVGIGSHPFEMDVLSAQLAHEIYVDVNLKPGNIVDGHTYYILAQATNRAGLKSPFAIKRIVVDRSPPVGGHVIDGSIQGKRDADFQQDISMIHGHWRGFTDPHSNLHYYNVGLGTKRYENDIQPLTYIGLTQETSWNGPFIPGQKYYITVEACNQAGLCTQRSSDGIIVDNSPPIKGLVRVGSGNTHETFLPHNSTVHIHWMAFEDPQSDVDHFEVCVGTSPNQCDVIDRRNVLLHSNIIRSDVELPINERLYATVWCFNRVGMNVSEHSKPFFVDVTSPNVVLNPKFLRDFNYIPGSKLAGQYEKSILRVNWKFNDDESPIIFHEVSLYTHHEGHTPVEHLRLGSQQDLTINLDDQNWLHSGDTYYIVVTSCNAAGLCTSAQTTDLLIDSTGPHMGGFKPPMTWSNFKDIYGQIRTNVTLAWYGFFDQESEINQYFITVSHLYSGQELSNGELNFIATNASQQSATFSLAKAVSQDDRIVLTIWAQNNVGLNSSVARVSVSALSMVSSTATENQHGAFELEKHSCDVHFCNNDCTCAVVGQPCVDVATNLTCMNESDADNLDLQSYIVLGGLSTQVYNITASSACLSGSWRLDTKSHNVRSVHRFEWSLGIENEPVGAEIFDLKSERPWNDIGIRTEFVHCLSLNSSLKHAEKYVVYVRVWYAPDIYRTFVSDHIVIDQTPPSVRKGRYIKDGDASCKSDLDFIDWTDSITGCWKGVFSEQQSKITHFLVSFGTSPGSDDVMPTTNVGLDTNITLINLSLHPGAHNYFTVTAINTVGLHKAAYSDGIVVDTDTPTAGVVFNTKHHQDSPFQSTVAPLSFSWHGFQDHFSGIASYKIGILTSSAFNESDIEMVDVGLQTTHTFSNATFEHGLTYYAVVIAIDAAGHVSDHALSNGVLIDESSPIVSKCLNFVEMYSEEVSAQHIFISTEMDEGTLYKLRGFISTSHVRAVTINVDNTFDRVPITRNFNGTVNYEYAFISRTSGHVNATIAISTDDNSNVASTVKIERCTSIVESETESVDVKQIGGRVLHVSMVVTDVESGIRTLLLGLGTTPGGFQVKPLTRIHNYDLGALIHIHLQHKSNVYATVIGENHAGLRSVFQSRPITIDHTPPELSGLSASGIVSETNSTGVNTMTATISTSWTIRDEESDIKYCLCKIGTSPDMDDVSSAWVTAAVSTCLSDDIHVEHGDRLYVTVVCVNAVELSEKITSTPVVISLAPPNIDHATATFVPINEKAASLFDKALQQHPSQSNETCLQIRWNDFADKSGIVHYEYRIRDQSNTVVDWTDVGRHDMASINGLRLSSGGQYTAEIRAINVGNHASDNINTSLNIATRPPGLTGYAVVVQRQSDKLHLDWSTVFHLVADVPVSYTLVMGSQEGFTDIADISYTSGHEYDVTVPPSTLITQQLNEIYIKITCTYATGLHSTYSSSYKL